MRCMNRNKVKFFYSLYEGREPITDEYGNVTGEYDVKHGNPTEGYANISATKGETQTRQFGESETYDKVIVMDNEAPLIDEYSVLWVDTVPRLNEDGSLIERKNRLTAAGYDYNAVQKKIEELYY